MPVDYDRQAFVVNGRQLKARPFAIAGLSEAGYLTNEQGFSLAERIWYEFNLLMGRTQSNRSCSLLKYSQYLADYRFHFGDPAMRLPLLLPLSFALLAFPTKVLAHVVETNYLLTNDRLEITANYNTGEPVEKTPVVVYAPNNPSQPWMQGTTDAQGRFSFQPDPKIQGDWTVEIGEVEKSDHGDILTVPVDKKGVEFEKISQIPQNKMHLHDPLTVMGVIALSGSAATTFLLTRKQGNKHRDLH
jgi:nickel transport protein